ncbi:MAG: hypothetical protein KAH21_00770, partial [Spirochaetaceae bacterium]|nr:hypothetical protein [Spirochaetaceae bacterium]
MSDWNQFPEYVSVAKRRVKNAKAAKKLAGKFKKGNITPIIISGRSITQTWWGKEWCKNLERYPDYANRLPRGRSYVRHGSVLHLEINPGTVSALVQGSRGAPYKVEIKISRLPEDTWSQAIKACSGKINSLKALMAGKIPKDLMESFTGKGTGLFPSPKEIALGCTCPDWAVMCKHVAAVLYGVGARLDENPSLFFTLRRVNQEELLDVVAEGAAEELVSRAGKKSRRVMDDADLSSVFGIDMDNSESPVSQSEKHPKVISLIDRVYSTLKKFPNGAVVNEIASAS